MIQKEIELKKLWDGKGEPWCIFSHDGDIVKDEIGRELSGRGKIVIRWLGSAVDATDLIEENDETDSLAALRNLKQAILDRAEKDGDGLYLDERVKALFEEHSARLERTADFDEIKNDKFINGYVVTHFHPDPEFRSFSCGDFKFAVHRKPFELRVFGPDGGTFVFREVYKDTTWDEFNMYRSNNPMKQFIKSNGSIRCLSQDRGLRHSLPDKIGSISVTVSAS